MDITLLYLTVDDCRWDEMLCFVNLRLFEVPQIILQTELISY